VPAVDTVRVGDCDGERDSDAETERVVRLEGARVTAGVNVVRLTVGESVAEPEWEPETVAVRLGDPESVMDRVSVGVAEREKVAEAVRQPVAVTESEPDCDAVAVPPSGVPVRDLVPAPDTDGEPE